MSSCWGTGELKQYDVADPFHPRETGSVSSADRAAPAAPGRARPAARRRAADGGAQPRRQARLRHQLAVRVWDLIFYPDGVGAWMAKLDADLDRGGIAPDARFFPNGDDFRGLRVHQTRLQGGDASSDSYCYTS